MLHEWRRAAKSAELLHRQSLSIVQGTTTTRDRAHFEFTVPVTKVAYMHCNTEQLAFYWLVGAEKAVYCKGFPKGFAGAALRLSEAKHSVVGTDGDADDAAEDFLVAPCCMPP